MDAASGRGCERRAEGAKETTNGERQTEKCITAVWQLSTPHGLLVRRYVRDAFSPTRTRTKGRIFNQYAARRVPGRPSAGLALSAPWPEKLLKGILNG
jgi:hypothetical protein